MRPAAAGAVPGHTASTMLLKQHSVIDVVFGILLAAALDYAATLLQTDALPRRTLRRRLPQWR